MNIYLASILLILISSMTAQAGEADVLKVAVTKTGASSFQFEVTVAHQDEGWDHYVDKWEIVDALGAVLATRVLYHPHVNEQPFTRSLSGVKIAAETRSLRVRAQDSVHGYGGKSFAVDLSRQDP